MGVKTRDIVSLFCVLATVVVSGPALAASHPNPCPAHYSLFLVEIGMSVEDLLAIYPQAVFRVAKFDEHQYRLSLKTPFHDLAIRSADITVVLNSHGRVCQVFTRLHGSIAAPTLEAYLSRVWGRQNLITSDGSGWDPGCGVDLRMGIGTTGRASGLILDWLGNEDREVDDLLRCG
jgi:hypothetical protein